MTLKRYISLLLASVYLFAVGGSAVLSLTCHCIAEQTHVCCHHCAQHEADGESFGNPLLNAPCCNDNHSTEVDLYTPAETSKVLKRIAILDLPVALAPQMQDSCEVLHSAADHSSEHSSPHPQATPRFVRGLRAPPVSA